MTGLAPAPSPPTATRSRLRQIAMAAIGQVGFRRFADIHNLVIRRGFLGSGLGRPDFNRIESVFLIAQSLLWTAEDGVDIDWWHDWAVARLGHLDICIDGERDEGGPGELTS